MTNERCPFRANLPVGKNLRAHVCVEPFFTVWNPPPEMFVRIKQSQYLNELDTYLQTERKGAFSQANTTAGSYNRDYIRPPLL